MQTSRPKRFIPNYAGIAWLIVPLALFIGLLLLLFGSADDDPAQPKVLAKPSPDTELVSIGSAPASTATAASLTTQFTPPDEQLYQRMGENLRRFRTDFRQMAPAINVSAVPGSKNRDKAVAALADMLASEQLSGHPDASVADTRAKENVAADLILYTRQANREIVFRFLAAISPYLSGRVLLVFNDDFTLDRLHLVFRDEPLFTPSGAVVFPDGKAQAGAG
tara:strand:- start:1417 stop:2082 length:666 start_codon:yes stop_codon:yes gene_type:complete